MILILSIYGDYSTTRICSWLNYYNKPFLRVNGDKNTVFFEKMDYEKKEMIFSEGGQEYNFFECQSVWYRKCGIRLINFRTNYDVMDSDFFSEKGTVLSELVQNENKTLSSYIHTVLERKKHIGKKYNVVPNKLAVLDQAKHFGLDIPESYVLTKKNSLKDLLIEKGNLITKALGDGIYEFFEDNAYYSYTEMVSLSDLDNYPPIFSPTLFQTLIQKEYELRIFFFDERYYPMVIFSQENEETKVDSRKESEGQYSRNIPFNLPQKIEDKLRLLMKKLDLNTGSIDIIVDENDKYIFLEVNPVGQFSMVSDPCNYYLEKEIAVYL